MLDDQTQATFSRLRGLAQPLLIATLVALSACNKDSLKTHSAQVPPSTTPNPDDKSGGQTPAAIAGTNLVDLDTGSLGLEVEYNSNGDVTLRIRWFVKSKFTENNRTIDGVVEAGGFANKIQVSGTYAIVFNGQDISSRCNIAADKQSALCQGLKVSSPKIQASVKASLIHLESGKTGSFEAEAPFIMTVAPGSLRAAGGELTLTGEGFVPDETEVSIVQSDKKLTCESVKVFDNATLQCHQPETTILSGQVDLRLMRKGRSFLYRNAYSILGQNLFINTNCDQVFTNIKSSGLMNAWAAPTFDGPAAANLLPVTTPIPGGTIIAPVTIPSGSILNLNQTLTGTVRGADPAATWCIAGAGALRNTGSMTINGNGGYSQDIPLFCGKQLVSIITRLGEKTAIGTWEVERTGCTTNEMMVTLSWGADATDMELHLIRPNGVLNNIDASLNDCTWTSCLSNSLDWGIPGDPSDNPRKDIDWTGTSGTENITLPKPENVSYAVVVEYWGAGLPSDARISVNALGLSDTLLLSDAAFQDSMGTPVKGNLLSLHSVWFAGTVNFVAGVPQFRLHKNVNFANRSQVLFDCSSMWSGGCKSGLRPAPLP